MFLELIATVIAGIGAAGVVMLLIRAGVGLPRWSVPVVAGLAMIAATITSEYGWYDRTRANLPDGLTVVDTVESRALYRPWTYLFPYVNRFAALDVATLKRNPARPGERIGDLYFFGRWQAVQKLPILLDCTGQRRASLADGAEFDADGTVTDARWIETGADDPVLAAGCGAA